MQRWIFCDDMFYTEPYDLFCGKEVDEYDLPDDRMIESQSDEEEDEED